MKFLEKVGNGITKLNNKVAFAASLLIFPLIFFLVIEVFFRYVLRSPSNYTYDLAWMTYAAFVFLGGGYALAKDVHVRADVFYVKLKKRGKAIMNMFCYPIFFFSSMWALLYSTYLLMSRAWTLSETSPFTSWNPHMGPIRTVFFICFVLLTLQGIVHFASFFKDLKKGGGTDDA